MDKLSNLALIAQMLDSAEKSIQSAKHLLRESLGGTLPSTPRPVLSTASPAAAIGMGVGKVIEGFFDGQNMIGPDGKQYPVPANYASKSKLIEGDALKLTISDDGSFIYKQIGPAERRRVLGILVQDDRGDFRVVADGKPYKVLLASVTYFKAEPGDEVALEVPLEKESAWGAVVNVLKHEQGSGSGSSGSLLSDDTNMAEEGDTGNNDGDSYSPAPVAPEEEEL